MNIRKILKAAFFTPTARGWGLPLGLEASPGTSKTSQVKDAAVENGLATYEVLSPGERGEGAFGVVPVPEERAVTVEGEKHTVLGYPMPEWAHKFHKAGRGLVFVDELTTAPPALQPAMLGLFFEGRIGGNQLPPGTRFLAAYNAPDEAAAGFDLPLPVANRMGHIKFDAGSVEDWCDWLFNVGSVTTKARLDPEAEEKRVEAEFPEAFALAKGLVAGFLQARPEFLHKQPPLHDPQASRAWPSRRTWEYATRALAAAAVHELDDEDRDTLVAAFIGDAVAGELFTFIDNEQLPKPVDVLTGRVQFKHNPRRLDITYAVLNGITAHIISTKDRDAKLADTYMVAAWELLTEICGAKKTGKKGKDGQEQYQATGAKDVVFGPARRLAQAGGLKHKAARPVLAALNDMMREAGIDA